MIHIKNDKRVLRSANLIQEGLVKCLKYKEFNEISISDIQRESSISRATFYRIFDNLYDVLYYQCNLLATTMEEGFSKKNAPNIENFLFYSLSFWLDNYRFLEAIFTSNRVDILQTVMQEHSEYLKKMLNLHAISKIELNYFISSSTALLSSILMTWIKNGKKENPEELYKLYVNVINLTSELIN
ncbi:MAG: TetR/AcrR family transcriptional regulator [Enterococcus sp.]